VKLTNSEPANILLSQSLPAAVIVSCVGRGIFLHFTLLSDAYCLVQLMPGVTVLPPQSPTSGSFDSNFSVNEIKQKAREAVRKEARGASALTLLKTAKTQMLTARDFESQGDLKEALSAFTKVASLLQMTMDTAEFASESRGKGGVLKKEFAEFYEASDPRCYKIFC
jgi:TPR repeat protein